MKSLIILLCIFLLADVCTAQLFKNLVTKAKEEVEYRVHRKAGQKIDEGLDKVLELPKKIMVSKNGNEPAPEHSTVPAMKANAAQDEDLAAKDGFITVRLSSPTVFTGAVIQFSGESAKYKQYNSVEITVNGPGTREVKTASLDEEGKYQLEWRAGDNPGAFSVTVKSSDKKAQKNEPFTVAGADWMNNWCDDNIAETKKAYHHLEDAVNKTKESLGAKDKAALEKKLGDVKERVDQLEQLFNDLNAAGKETARLAQKSKPMPRQLCGNLDALNKKLADQARQMKEFNRLADHQPQDNTICEYLVMVNEACAAFSTVTNFWGKSIVGVLKDIALDKGVPKITGDANSAAGGISGPYDFPLTQMSKVYALSKFDAEGLTSKMGAAEMAGDILQFASDVLLKAYCGTFSGEVTHDYTINFRNGNGESWWRYGVKMKGALSLRYPKKGAESGIIKMKGSIEGNAIDFSFFQHVAVEEGFTEGTKGKIEVVELKTLKPPSVPFVSSQSDKLGFGAAARTLVTPASFYIPIDAEYDPDNDKIKIFINPAIVDFTPFVKNTFIFLLVGADLLPYIKKMDFPIHPAQLTMKSSLKEDNEFTVDKDKSNNLSFVAKRNRHLGSPSAKIETDLNFYISAKKD